MSICELPDANKKGRWGEGITPEEMKTLRWVKPRYVVDISSSNGRETVAYDSRPIPVCGSTKIQKMCGENRGLISPRSDQISGEVVRL